MILIAHRGNYKGKEERMENTPAHILKAISLGFAVEVDVWMINQKLYLGHDGPQVIISGDPKKFLDPIAKHCWFHAKNLEALQFLSKNGYHTFFHDQDQYTLTSKGYIWGYTGNEVGPYGIIVMPESTPGFKWMYRPAGICSDNVSQYLDTL